MSLAMRRVAFSHLPAVSLCHYRAYDDRAPTCTFVCFPVLPRSLRTRRFLVAMTTKTTPRVGTAPFYVVPVAESFGAHHPPPLIE